MGGTDSLLLEPLNQPRNLGFVFLFCLSLIGRSPLSVLILLLISGITAIGIVALIVGYFIYQDNNVTEKKTVVFVCLFICLAVLAIVILLNPLCILVI